jgi:crotonobetainyl-CoA:carnitine CoA-transferase CaiB-like acyl-CoA transferase
LNRHKKSLVIDLATSKGARIVRELAAKADILVENFRPGVMQRLGLGYDELALLNPSLIYCGVSGFGMSGPLRDKPSFDIVTQAMSGVLSLNGEPGRDPVKLGLPLGDMVGGIFGSVGVLSALHERHRTGRGRLVDISLHDGMLGMLGYLAQLYFVTGVDPKPVGTSHPNIAPYGAFPASDGLVIIACLIQGFWRRLCETLERPDLADDPRFATAAARLANRDDLNQAISAITRTRTVAEWVARLEANDVPHAPILGVGAALNHPHSLARDMLVTAEHPAAGTVKMVGRPIKFPGAEQEPLRAAPSLGQHTAEVLQEELGFDAETIARLREDGVIDRFSVPVPQKTKP